MLFWKDNFILGPGRSLGVTTIAEVARDGGEGPCCPRSVPGLDAVLPLREIEINLPLAEIYEGVEFILEREDNEAN